MNIKINHTKWINPGDPLHGFEGDIRIVDGKIAEWGANLPSYENENQVDARNSLCSPGWIDLKVRVGAPGNPQHESLDQLFKAAAAGGFTKILISPDTKPVIQSPESVYFFKNLTNAQGVQVLVSAAASLNLEGKKMTEMLRLMDAGASAYSFVHPVTDSGFLLQVLLYAKHSGKVVFHFPQDSFLALNGQIHEGEVSDRRGLAGIPSIAETIAINRDLAVLEYSKGKLHFSSLSLGSSPALIAKAKKSGLDISCDVAAHQLAFTDENLDQFDTNFKVMPPLRPEEDRQALINSVLNGEVDAIVSDHNPWHYDVKDCEFDLAKFGISSLETAYSCLQTYAKGIGADRVVSLLAQGPRKILGMEIPAMKTGMEAELTLFQPDKKWKVEGQKWQSKSKNTPFIGMELTGQVQGIVSKNGFIQNPHF